MILNMTLANKKILTLKHGYNYKRCLVPSAYHSNELDFQLKHFSGNPLHKDRDGYQ